MQYLGRIRLPELEFLGGKIELDHSANWFFHVFMDTNTNSPHYAQAPSRIVDTISGPILTGLSVYGKWEIGDPTIADPNIWQRDIPQTCSSDGSAVCHSYPFSTVAQVV